MLKISNLHVSYKDADITYKDISIKDKQITFIKGKNGSGKTSLLKSIAGLIEHGGEITTNGFITYSSQEPVIFNMTGLENITYPLRIRKQNVDDYLETINYYTELLEVKELLQVNATQFSSGEKMKIAIIRSIIFDPEYVLLDEPTTHLDIESIDALVTLIKSLKDRITFIIVSHNKQFLEALIETEIELGEENVQRKNTK